ncbi:hypothetical protein [Streptosporangium sp. KLBMP 9127]|nr:hypothetical protein [Streptosporangium sp. KLBMP 9127]
MYLDGSELASTLGEVHLFLAHSTNRPQHTIPAVDLLRSAHDLRASERTRSRVFDLIGLSRAYLAMGEPEAAAIAASTACLVL